jgi:hypothetical protein
VDERGAIGFYMEFGYLRCCCHGEASSWLSEFQKMEYVHLREEIRSALTIMKKGDRLQASQLLDSIRRGIRENPASHSSITDLLTRQYLSVLAYLQYLSGDLEAAKESLTQAHAEIVRVTAAYDFLLPVAIQCIDILTQRTRMARRESQWGRVKYYLSILNKIYSDRAPLCTLPCGRDVLLSDIRSFFASLPLEDAERARVRFLLSDHRTPGEGIELLEEMIFVLPDLVIPYG